MFRSINSKFYAVAFLLLVSFGSGYLILAYFQHKQNQSAKLAQSAMQLEQDVSLVMQLFHEARFWEKVTLSNTNPEADMRFGSSIERIRGELFRLIKKDLDPQTQQQLKEISVKIDQYENHTSSLVQLKTQQSLHGTKMETNYRSMASVILSSDNPNLLKPLYNFTHFFISYRTSRDFAKYQALKLVSKSLQTRINSQNIQDIRLGDYIQSFNSLLDKNYELELEILTVNSEIEEVNSQLRAIISAIDSRSKMRLASSLEETKNIKNELRNLFLLSTALGILLLLFILFIISRSIIVPIRRISAVMREVQGGERGVRFMTSRNPDEEIVQFGHSFNEMLDTLESNSQELLDYQQSLEEKIQQLSDREKESKRLAAKLEQVKKMEALGTLAGGVAHDLNNILSGIVSYPELLLIDIPGDSPLRSKIKLIQESGLRASAIVQDLLTLARRGVEVREVTNLNLLVEQYLESPEHEKLRLNHPNVTFDLDLEENLANMSGSTVHLLKSIMNLVSNGAESIRGAGIIQLRTEYVVITQEDGKIGSIPEGEYTALSIRDTGSGISREDMEHIFEPFFTKKEMGTSGTGLGLAVVWGTVQDHNGFIETNSSPEGTVFTLYFPVSAEEIHHPSQPTPIAAYLGNGEKILVVDDADNQREIAQSILVRLGYTVDTVGSGEEAIQYVLNYPVDALLLDMLMPPGMDGFETYREILTISPQLPAVIASGFSETSRVKETQQIGPAQYIKKPYSIEKIGMALRDALGKMEDPAPLMSHSPPAGQ